MTKWFLRRAEKTAELYCDLIPGEKLGWFRNKIYRATRRSSWRRCSRASERGTSAVCSAEVPSDTRHSVNGLLLAPYRSNHWSPIGQLYSARGWGSCRLRSARSSFLRCALYCTAFLRAACQGHSKASPANPRRPGKLRRRRRETRLASLREPRPASARIEQRQYCKRDGRDPHTAEVPSDRCDVDQAWLALPRAAPPAAQRRLARRSRAPQVTFTVDLWTPALTCPSHARALST